MRKRFSRDEWVAWIAEQKNSGRSVASFCDELGVSQNSFYLWKRKLRLNEAAGKQAFVPVSVSGSCEGNKVEIEIPGGSIIRLADDELTLRKVLSALASLGRDQ